MHYLYYGILIYRNFRTNAMLHAAILILYKKLVIPDFVVSYLVDLGILIMEED